MYKIKESDKNIIYTVIKISALDTEIFRDSLNKTVKTEIDNLWDFLITFRCFHNLNNLFTWSSISDCYISEFFLSYKCCSSSSDSEMWFAVILLSLLILRMIYKILNISLHQLITEVDNYWIL